MKSILPLAVLFAVATSMAFGQSATFRYTVRTKSFQGEITEVRGSTLIWETDGQTGPIPYNKNTRLNVTAKGDPGFVGLGSVVTVSGLLKPDKTIIDATMTVHLNPQQTANIGNANVNQNDPQITIKGRLVNLNPLTIKAIDTITMTSGGQANRAAGGTSPPIFGAVLPFKLRVAKPETINLLLGSAPNFIAAGDSATVVVAEDNPKVASSITIRKTEPLESPKARAAKAKADTEKTEDDKKSDEEKTDAEKPSTEEKMTTEKMAAEKMTTEKMQSDDKAKSEAAENK